MGLALAVAGEMTAAPFLSIKRAAEGQGRFLLFSVVFSQVQKTIQHPDGSPFQRTLIEGRIFMKIAVLWKIGGK